MATAVYSIHTEQQICSMLVLISATGLLSVMHKEHSLGVKGYGKLAESEDRQLIASNHIYLILKT